MELSKYLSNLQILKLKRIMKANPLENNMLYLVYHYGMVYTYDHIHVTGDSIGNIGQIKNGIGDVISVKPDLTCEYPYGKPGFFDIS